jgi:hypothetical protein
MGTWPAKLELVPLQGEAVEIPFDPAECEALLADAVMALARINAIIAEFASHQKEAEARLASPSVTACRHCLFRPACAAYREARTGLTRGEAWPEDVWGDLREMRRLGNGKFLLTVVTGPAEGAVRHLRGITPDPARHPALQHLQKGDKVGIFSLKGAEAGATLSESLWTVIYKMVQVTDG